MYLKLLQATSSTAGSGGGAELFGRKDLARHSQRQGRGAFFKYLNQSNVFVQNLWNGLSLNGGKISNPSLTLFEIVLRL